MFRIAVWFQLPCGFPCLFPLFGFGLLSDNTGGEKEISIGSPQDTSYAKNGQVNEGKEGFSKKCHFLHTCNSEDMGAL